MHDQLAWAAEASGQLSWSLGLPARARSEAAGGSGGERRHVLRGIGSVGSVDSKRRQAGSTRQVGCAGTARR